MAGHEDGDEFFSDDDLDGLPQNALDELEHDAIQQTQHQTQVTQLHQGPPSSDYGDDFDDEDLDDAEVFDAAQGLPNARDQSMSLPTSTTNQEQLRQHYGGSNDMKSITGRPLNQDWTSNRSTVPPYAPQRLQYNVQTANGQAGFSGRQNLSSHVGKAMGSTQSRSIKVGVQSMGPPQSSRPSSSLRNKRPSRPDYDGVLQPSTPLMQQSDAPPRQIPNEVQLEAVSGSQNDLVLLLKQLSEARQQQEALKQELNSKAGEIAIVRSKEEKAKKEHERELTSVRKLNAERIAKQQKEIEAAKEAERTAATELEFLRRDLLDESEKVRVLKRAKDKGKGNLEESITTPKKTKAYRDGFDDDEIQVISPIKLHTRKSNPSTPTKAGGKRKRKGVDSPSIPLEISREELPQDQIPLPPTAVIDDAFLDRIRKPDDRLIFLELIFDHRPYKHHLRTLEEFASLAFPSVPHESFASIVLGRLSGMNQKKAPSDFPIEFCELVINLWSRCLTEKYYKPIYLLVDLLTFALEFKTIAIAPHIIDSLLFVAQMTCDLVAIPRFKREPCSQFDGVIDVSACLALIHLAALGCMGEQEHAIRFWQLMRLDFVLMMLSQHQPPKDFDMTLRLLSLSIMKDSIGPRVTDQDKQQEQAGYIIDRISLLLIISPTAPEGLARHEPSVISSLHLQILRTFNAFCQTPYGTEALALHRYAIGRLVKLMSQELDALYDYHSEHQKSARLICLVTRLLHHLVTKHDKSINMQKKLSEIHGGNQKYLICLARLNFSEDDLVLDADIDPEIAECAHELLELAVTPEEGDAIHSAFSSQ